MVLAGKTNNWPGTNAGASSGGAVHRARAGGGEWGQGFLVRMNGALTSTMEQGGMVWARSFRLVDGWGVEG